MTTITSATLFRGAGMCAIAAGVLYATIQFVHPPEELASVATPAWTLTAWLTFAMATLGLIGIAGLHLRQPEAAGLVGLVGATLFGAFHLLAAAFSFVEALVLPLLADEAPEFVTSFLGLFADSGPDGTLGALEAVVPVAGVLYLGGGFLFGVALVRAGVLARWAAGVLAGGAVLPVATAFLPHALHRLTALPVAVALVGLGWSLVATRPGERP